MMTCALLAVSLLGARAEVDPNFYVYLCFGQSNMEGQAKAETVDMTVDPRFKTLACVDFTNPVRKKGQWYDAVPPIVRQWTNVGMADYFGRTMVAALPAGVKVGVVDVAIGGVDIKAFMSEQVADYVKTAESWMKSAFAEYDNDPYKRLVEMAKIAQQQGVIKGILLHQGETNNGQADWPQKVKTIYDRLLSDLGLNAADVPLFAGETVNADVGGTCSLHNSIIARLPQTIANAHVVRSNGCPCASDNIHFTVAGYRTMGKRYAYEALRTLGLEPRAAADYAWNSALKDVYALKSLDPIDDITVKVGGARAFKVWGTFADGHREDLTAEAVISSSDFVIADGMLKATEAKKGTVTIAYTDFLGTTLTTTVNVEATDQGPNRLLVVDNGTAGSNAWDKEMFCDLATPMTKGKTYVVKATIKADTKGNCTLWPRWDASTNRDQWGNSADVQYLASQAITTVAQEYTWEFKADFPHDCLIFAIGDLGGKVCFDDVSCREKGSDVELTSNGNFDSDDLSHWRILDSWSGMKSIKIEDEAVTAVAAPKAGAAEGDVYNLQGVKVGSGRNAGALRGGLYIVNGRKMVK